MKKLYRLKSNPKTIVYKEGGYSRIYWSRDMESGKDVRWMMATWNEENVEPLSRIEVAGIKIKVAEFDAEK